MSEENKNKPPIKSPIPPPLPTPIQPTQQNPQILALQAIGNLNTRMTGTEIEIHKINANNDVFNNRFDLLRKTIDLLEKQMNFNEKKANLE